MKTRTTQQINTNGLQEVQESKSQHEEVAEVALVVDEVLLEAEEGLTVVVEVLPEVEEGLTVVVVAVSEALLEVVEVAASLEAEAVQEEEPTSLLEVAEDTSWRNTNYVWAQHCTAFRKYPASTLFMKSFGETKMEGRIQQVLKALEKPMPVYDVST